MAGRMGGQSEVGRRDWEEASTGPALRGPARQQRSVSKAAKSGKRATHLCRTSPLQPLQVPQLLPQVPHIHQCPLLRRLAPELDGREHLRESSVKGDKDLSKDLQDGFGLEEPREDFVEGEVLFDEGFHVSVGCAGFGGGVFPADKLRGTSAREVSTFFARREVKLHTSIVRECTCNLSLMITTSFA